MVGSRPFFYLYFAARRTVTRAELAHAGVHSRASKRSSRQILKTSRVGDALGHADQLPSFVFRVQLCGGPQIPRSPFLESCSIPTSLEFECACCQTSKSR